MVAVVRFGSAWFKMFFFVRFSRLEQGLVRFNRFGMCLLWLAWSKSGLHGSAGLNKVW
jgi:hypothetical protein